VRLAEQRRLDGPPKRYARSSWTMNHSPTRTFRDAEAGSEIEIVRRMRFRHRGLTGDRNIKPDLSPRAKCRSAMGFRRA